MFGRPISVCMTTYNGALYIKEQLSSILPQLGANDEVLISDDGSTDETINIIQSFKDSRIILFHSNFKNVILNFEYVVSKATGEIIFLSDQDDIWYSNKVEKSLQLLEKNDLIFTNVNVFQTTTEKGKLMYDLKKNYNGIQRNFIKNHCVGATMAFKSHVLKYALPFPKRIEMHDMWIFFISSFYGKTLYYEKPLIHYRRHGLNVSNTGGKTSNSIFRIIVIRISWIYYLFMRIIKTTIQNK